MTAVPSRPAWRGLLAPALATLAAFAVLIGLGVWQLERKAWKEGLIEQIEARAHGAPGIIVPEARWPDWSAAADEFRRVRLRGAFLDDLTVPVHGLAELRQGQALQGYYLLTPLRLPDGAIVIVNRGIVPTELLSRTLASLKERDGGDQEVTGLVRASQERGAFVPVNRPDENDWFVRDVPEIARVKSLTRVAPFLIDQDMTAPDGWPRGGQTQLTLRNGHLQYAITWFSLAVVLLAVFAVFARNRMAGRDEGPAVSG